VLLEDFQQTLFAIGTDVYKQANKDKSDIEMSIEIVESPIDPLPMVDTQVPQFNFDLDEENNSQADYETID
jgi:molecular chaperone DnaK